MEGLNGVINIADDICVYGCGDTKEEADIDHDRNLTQLLEKCNKHDLRFSTKKMQFKSSSISFMGHRLTNKGVQPDPIKVAAIIGMPTFPRNVPGLVQVAGPPKRVKYQMKSEPTGTSETRFQYMMECFSNLIKSLFPHRSDLSSYRRYTKRTKAQIVAYEEPGNLFTGQECRQQLSKHAPRVVFVPNT